MKGAVVEITRISQALPPRKAARLLQFARALEQGVSPRARGEPRDGDAEWERIIKDPRPKPKLAAKLKELERLAIQGKDEPTAWDRL